MVGVNMFVFVALSCVVGLVSVDGGVVDLIEIGRVMEKPNEFPRLDSGIDSTTNITLVPTKPESTLFGACRAQADSATVRFRQLNSQTGQYTRYVPSDEQMSMYDPDWTRVTSAPIKSFLDCYAFAEQTKAMMFKFDGSKCEISNLRLSTSSPKCGDSSADAIFVRTSCPDPSVPTVTITTQANAMDVTWSASDTCNLATKYRVTWSDGSYVTADNTATTYRITDLPGCQTDTVTVVPLDSLDAPWGQSGNATATTDSDGPTVSNVQVTATGMVTYDITWDLYDPCGLVDTQHLGYDWQSFLTHPGDDENATATRASVILEECRDLEVTVAALDASGAELSSAASDRTTPLHSTTCTTGFSASCSGCIHQNNVKVDLVTALSYCTNLNSASGLVSVASQDEFTALRAYLTANFPGTLSYWIDMTKNVDGEWVWGSGYVQPSSGSDWFTGWPVGGTCSYMSANEGYKLNDVECSRTDWIRAMCYYI